MNRFWVMTSAIIATAAMPTNASSPDAWAKLQQRAERACIASSAYIRPRVSQPIIFSDTNGQVALLVTGSLWQRSRLLKVSGLCLFNRRTGLVEVQESQGWSSSPQ